MAAGAGAFGPTQRGEKYQVRVRAEPGGPCRYRTFDTFKEAEDYRLEQGQRIKGEGVFVRNGRKEMRTHPDLRTVYFVQGEAGGPIKIGSAVRVGERIDELQAGNPARLVLLATSSGGEKQERRWHKEFLQARVRGEWFEPVPALILLIGKLRG